VFWRTLGVGRRGSASAWEAVALGPQRANWQLDRVFVVMQSCRGEGALSPSHPPLRHNHDVVPIIALGCTTASKVSSACCTRYKNIVTAVPDRRRRDTGGHEERSQ